MSQNRADLQPFLDRLTTRTHLSDAEQQVILDLPLRLEQVQANRDVIRQGTIVSHVCVVLSGMAGRCGQTADDARQITALHFPGDAADLHSVMLPAASSAVQALTAVTIARVPHAALRDAAAKFPAIAEAFWRDCVHDAAILSEWMVNVGQRDARSRLAHLLCEIAVRSHARLVGAETVFALPLTQGQIAEATGLTAVHVNRMLKTLKEDGLAAVGQRTARVLDWAALARLGEFDPGYLGAEIAPAQQARGLIAA